MNYKLLILSLFVFLISCENEKKINYEKTSREIIGNEEYNKIYQQARDSIKIWIDSNLGNYGYFRKYNRGNELDKILCFNHSKNKLVGALLINHKEFENATLDDIWFFYGVKIKDTWYFFTGADITLPREIYQSDIHTPLSFEKLHEIALKEVFSGYLKKKEPIVPWYMFWMQQEYEVDESYFDKHFRGQGWGGGDWIENSDGSNGHWNGRIYTDEEFNKMYKEKALSVWPSSNPLTSFYDINIKRWRNIHQDSFDILLKAKKINPNGTSVE